MVFKDGSKIEPVEVIKEFPKMVLAAMLSPRATANVVGFPWNKYGVKYTMMESRRTQELDCSLSK